MAAPAAASPAALSVGAPPQLAGTQLLGTSDKALLDAVVAKSWASPSARRVLEEFNRLGAARIVVLSDAEFTASGDENALGSFSPSIGIIKLRRSQLEESASDPKRLGAVATFVHEAGHAVDVASGVEQQFVAAAGGKGTSLLGDASIVFAMEARGEYLEGIVVRELDGTLKSGRRVRDVPLAEILANDANPALVASTGGSFEQVWQKVQSDSGRNPNGLTGVRMLTARNAIL